MRYGLSLQRSSLQALEVESWSAKQRDVSTGGPRTEEKALDVRGTWLEQQALDSLAFRWHPQGAQVRTGQVEVALAYNVGSDDSTEDDEPASRKPEKDEAR